MNVLIIGDFHIPDREREIPSEIWQEVKNTKFDLIICTGDLTDPNLLEKLQSIATVKIVNGNMDYYFGLRDLPRSLIVDLDTYKIGLIHGSGIRPRGDPEQLSKIAHQMQVPILVSGHTHALSLNKYTDILLINPGSATGSWGGGPSTGIPSFITIDEEKNQLKFLCISLKKGNLIRSINLYDIKTGNLT
jgi:vacuolar protein sorting-associated protein 29